MGRSLSALSVLALLAASGCTQREWVQIKPEPEGYPFDSAHKICHHWAEDRATVRPSLLESWPGQRNRTIDWAIYSYHYRPCMEHYGWIRQLPPPAEGETGAEPEAPGPDAPRESGGERRDAPGDRS